MAALALGILHAVSLLFAARACGGPSGRFHSGPLLLPGCVGHRARTFPSLQASGRMENLVGWYHSHPGYGCWLSGIDVGTQMTNQKYQARGLLMLLKLVVVMGWV